MDASWFKAGQVRAADAWDLTVQSGVAGVLYCCAAERTLADVDMRFGLTSPLAGPLASILCLWGWVVKRPYGWCD
jgi:hypothetical protein